VKIFVSHNVKDNDAAHLLATMRGAIGAIRRGLSERCEVLGAIELQPKPQITHRYRKRNEKSPSVMESARCIQGDPMDWYYGVCQE
jgi:hypothetical protein